MRRLKSEPVVKADQKFKKAIGKEPLQYHITTYDAMMILKKAFQAVGCDRDKLTTAVADTKDFPGIVGKVSFNARKDCPRRKSSGWKPRMVSGRLRRAIRDSWTRC